MSRATVNKLIKASNLGEDDVLKLPIRLFHSIQDEIVNGRYKGIKIEIPSEEMTEPKAIFKDEDRPSPKAARRFKTALEKKLDLFEDGEQRYQEDPLVNTCVRALLSGENPVKILDEVIKMYNSSQELLKKTLERVPHIPTNAPL